MHANAFLTILFNCSWKIVRNPFACMVDFPSTKKGPSHCCNFMQSGSDISSTRNENFAGPQHSANRGIAVTSTSGVHYSHQQPPPGPATFQPTQLPPYPAPSNGYPVYPQANGHVNNGYQQQQQLGQVAQPQAQRAYVPQRDPFGVSDNPMGRGVRMAPEAVNGSMDTLNTPDRDNSLQQRPCQKRSQCFIQ